MYSSSKSHEDEDDEAFLGLSTPYDWWGNKCHCSANGQYPRLSQQFRSKTLDRAPFVDYTYLVG